MDNDLRSVTSGASELTPSGAAGNGGRELEVSGGEVYLPASNSVKPGDDGFDRIVREVLPDCAPSLSANALCRPRGYSAAAVVLILCFLGGVVAMLACLSPGPPPPPPGTSLVGPAPFEVKYRGEFSEEYETAVRKIREGKFNAARSILEPIAEKTLSGDKIRTDGERKLLDTYFHLFDRLEWDGKALRLLRTARDRDPDCDNWQYFFIYSHPALRREDGKLKLPHDRSLRFPARHKDIVDRQRAIDKLVMKYQGDEEKKAKIEELKLLKCYLALNLWRMKNINEREDANGVEDREEALKIAREYPDKKDFIDVEIYIILTLMNGDIKGFYVFGGQEYYRLKHLKERLTELKGKIDPKRGGTAAR